MKFVLISNLKFERKVLLDRESAWWVLATRDTEERMLREKLLTILAEAQGGVLQWRIPRRHVGKGESPARPPRGLDLVSIGRHADREAPATTERVLRTRGWEKDLAQGAVPLAGFLI